MELVTEIPLFWANDSAWSSNNSENVQASSNFSDWQFSLEYKYFRDMSRFWVKLVLYPLIMCVGVLGNSITIVILTRRRMRSSTNHYLTALAISDLFYLIFAFTLSLNYYSTFQTFYFLTYWRFAVMLTDACSNTSVWLTVTFTIERYVAVCHPIRGKVLCTRSRAKKLIVGVVCLCFAVVIPTPFEWAVLEKIDLDSLNQTSSSFQLVYSSLGSDETYRKAYYWFTSITFVILPLSLLAIFNSFLIRSVHHSKSQRRRMTMRKTKKLDNAHQENRITIMLIAVVVMFLLCQLPTAVYLVYSSFNNAHQNSNEESILLGLGNIFNCLVAINAACNFILYCAFSDRYRRTFLRTFTPCLYRLGSPNHSQTNLTGALTNIGQENDSAVNKRRHSAEQNMSQCVRRNINKTHSQPENKNGHLNCHQMTTLAGSLKGKENLIDDQSSTLVTEQNGHNSTVLKSPLYLLDNGHLSTTHDDNRSDTTQETIVSNTETDGNEQKKRNVSISAPTDEVAHL